MRVAGAVAAVLFLAACGGGSGSRDSGQAIFRQTCAMCHGLNAEGRGILGNDLRSNEFIRGLDDRELADFIRVGRSATHPDNTRGIEMPPRGGNPRLTDAEIDDIVRFLRSMQ